MSADGLTITGIASNYDPVESAAYLLTPEGVVDLGVPPGVPDDWQAGAEGISGDGLTVVGVLADPDIFGTVNFHAFRWSASNGMEVLEEPFGGNQFFGEARDASADGAVTVGWIDPGPNAGGACRWDLAGKAHLLPALPGGSYSIAYAVSADGGTIVGSARDKDGYEPATRWTDAGAQTLGLQSGIAWDVSADGAVIVGTQDWEFAFVWDATNGARDLNQALTDQGVDLTGWVLRSAEGVSADGRTIVGWGDSPNGRTEAWIARLGGECYPDFTHDGTLDLFDFLGYVNAFNAGEDAADCDADSDLTLFDFLCFVNAFNTGC